MKEKKQKEDELKQKNRKQAEYLKQQIQEREEKASTMNQQEYLLNKQLLEKIDTDL